MYITDEAKQLLEKSGAVGIRLYTVPNSSEGPQIAFAIDEPHEFDRVQTIKGIKVAFDPSVTGTEILTLDKEENENGVGLVLTGPGSYS
ncbi:adhesin [Fredinandcohnia sp. QZ13]|uniref:adhesin n=1 Tax=Fredinandcohnia sp. QZ13 TaxID=3073144 RepID=UPI00285372D9|nr:adhesin [Fredinandcohnia sp. QZ13]MDR4889776.1 adhesin [Fredinandcohnia sp. QZ13]